MRSTQDVINRATEYCRLMESLLQGSISDDAFVDRYFDMWRADRDAEEQPAPGPTTEAFENCISRGFTCVDWWLLGNDELAVRRGEFELELRAILIELSAIRSESPDAR